MNTIRALDGTLLPECFPDYDSGGHGGEDNLIWSGEAWGDHQVNGKFLIMRIQWESDSTDIRRIEICIPNEQVSLTGIAEDLPQLNDPRRWVIQKHTNEKTEEFTARAKDILDSYTGEINGAWTEAYTENMVRAFLLWRYGMATRENRADTPKAKGLWGELEVLNLFEKEYGVANASSFWRTIGSKWDLSSPGVLNPLEVKTTTKNTHEHELRHDQLTEGRACHLRIVSVRCSVEQSTHYPTLEELLRARKNKAEELGVEGTMCVQRVETELNGLTDLEKSVRLGKQGTTIVVSVNDLPLLENIPEVYRKIKYTVTLESSDTTLADCLEAGAAAYAPQGAAGEVKSGLKLDDGNTLSGNALFHKNLILWAEEHARENMPWDKLRDEGDRLGNYIVVAGGGIHKPKGLQWATSVRSNPSSKYRDTDKNPENRWKDVWSSWYALEASTAAEAEEGIDTRDRRTGTRYTVLVGWVTDFDWENKRCRISSAALSSVPVNQVVPWVRDADKPAWRNKALWYNYVYQKPLVYLIGF